MEWWNLSREQMMNQKKSKQPGMETEPLIPAHVLRFMNSMPVASDPMAWINQFKEALQILLGDVDRIALFINMNYSLRYEHNIKRGIVTSQIGSTHNPDGNMMVSKFGDHNDLVAAYHEHLRLAGFPFKEYQPPVLFMYSVFGGSSLGAIWLFRRRGASPISPRTLETMEQLRPFIIFSLSHRVAQNIVAHPQTGTFFRITDDLMSTMGLTLREKEVFSLRLLGIQNKGIAEKLFLSEETICKHVRSILRKGKARTFIELFMRQYVPDLETMTVPSPTVRRSSRKGAKSAAKESPAREQNNLLIW